jgi:DNA-binding MarR family transcriptional regulator
MASWLINKISLDAHRLRKEGLASVNARAYHFSILAALEEFGPASQMSIGQRCGIDRSDTHAMVNELVDQGFVVSAEDPHDRRRNIITITTAGQKRLEQLDAVLRGVQDTLLAALSPGERGQLVGLLARLLDSHPASTT